MFQSSQFLTEILRDYGLIKQHSSGSPYLYYVNTLPCETDQQKLRLNKSAAEPYLVKWQSIQAFASQRCTNSLQYLQFVLKVSTRKHVEEFLHTIMFVFSQQFRNMFNFCAMLKAMTVDNVNNNAGVKVKCVHQQVLSANFVLLSLLVYCSSLSEVIYNLMKNYWRYGTNITGPFYLNTVYISSSSNCSVN